MPEKPRKVEIQEMKTPTLVMGLWLPLKRTPEFRLIRALFAQDPESESVGFIVRSGYPRVYTANMLMVRAERTPLKDVPFRDYDSFDELYDDGWRVD